MEFSRQEYRSGLPFPSAGDLPDPGTEPMSFASPALAGGFFTTSTTWEASTQASLKGQGSVLSFSYFQLEEAPGPCKKNFPCEIKVIERWQLSLTLSSP